MTSVGQAAEIIIAIIAVVLLIPIFVGWLPLASDLTLGGGIAATTDLVKGLVLLLFVLFVFGVIVESAN